jgi:hypothetical protein
VQPRESPFRTVNLYLRITFLLSLMAATYGLRK